MDVKIEQSWKSVLEEEFAKSYLVKNGLIFECILSHFPKGLVYQDWIEIHKVALDRDECFKVFFFLT